MEAFAEFDSISFFEENLPHSGSDGPTGYTHRWATTNPNITLLRRINPNGSNRALGLEGFFSSCEKNVSQCTSGDKKNITILELPHSLCFLVHPCSVPDKPKYPGIQRKCPTNPKYSHFGMAIGGPNIV